MELKPNKLLSQELYELEEKLARLCSENCKCEDEWPDFIDSNEEASQIQNEIDNINDFIQDHYGEH